MALLSEYALTPGVFDSSSYSTGEVGDLRLQGLKEVLLNEGIVRDLRDGQWSSLLADEGRAWHMRGKELIKKLRLQRRLRRSSPALGDDPVTDPQWCEESLASHEAMPLSGVITTRGAADGFQREPLVKSIDQLQNAPWWASRSSSVRLARTIDEYLRHLRLVLQCANSVMFIDPHLDPSLPQYRGFADLLRAMAGRSPAPTIEIHRVCYVGSGRNRQLITGAEWQSRFSNAWSSDLRANGLSVEVFVWGRFHDRYLISDLVGISVPNGFDTTTDPAEPETTWTRLGRQDRDKWQREFDPAANRYDLRSRWTLPR